MNSEYFRTMFEYDRSLYQEVWASVMQLTDDRFIQPVDYSRGAIRDQLLHVAAAQARWLRGIRGNPDARTFNLDPADYPTRRSVREVWQQVEDEVTAYMAELSDQDLEVVLPGMDGPLWQVLAHLINHGTDHRAQILRILHDFGAPTFDQDLIHYLWRS